MAARPAVHVRVGNGLFVLVGGHTPPSSTVKELLTAARAPLAPRVTMLVSATPPAEEAWADATSLSLSDSPAGVAAVDCGVAGAAVWVTVPAPPDCDVACTRDGATTAAATTDLVVPATDSRMWMTPVEALVRTMAAFERQMVAATSAIEVTAMAIGRSAAALERTATAMERTATAMERSADASASIAASIAAVVGARATGAPARSAAHVPDVVPEKRIEDM